jgi:hypothetical protein
MSPLRTEAKKNLFKTAQMFRVIIASSAIERWRDRAVARSSYNKKYLQVRAIARSSD